ncbi:hypothetical protein TSUD_34440 [Trifolium subterraneum]|uniref:Miro domain-containing protein n=1 Tax=Trifolium subterraneum TaxID=3900 RepID=A0A2Z6P0W6_TRISU|nr:hypothetical protein TSUD_34440 [Trifolium subterraneum]
MARASSNSVNPHARTGVRIVVAGDKGTGKSSLISTASSDNFRPNVAPVLPPTTLAVDLYPDHVPITIIDTSSRIEDTNKVAEELQRADTVVLTYACDRPETLENLSTFWLPHLRNLEVMIALVLVCAPQVKVPVIVVGCRLDLRDENAQVSLEQVMSPIMQQFREIETCIECSASRHIQSVELTNEAIDFLKTTFDAYDADFDGMLRPREIDELFSTAPESPWIGNLYEDAAERNAFQGLSLDAFLSEENRKYLVLKEIPEGGVPKLIGNKESLASCDIAVFVHDRSDESSWKASSELLEKIASHGEETGFEVPCLIVAAKDDLDSFTSAIQDSIRVSQDMVGAAVALVGLGAYRIYAARKSQSG